MIYLTFDTNIWIYALDDSWIIENQLDYIEHWVDNGKVKLLLPEEIEEEWKRNKSKQVKVRKERLQKFFKMAEEIIPDAFLFEYKKEATQSKIIESQLNRIENLFKNAKFIPADEKVHDRVIRDGLNKKAPLHKKSSVADAIIVFTLIQFAKDNPGNDYIFVSGNVDDFFDSKKGKKVHPDLEDEFNRYNIKLHRSLGKELIYPLMSKFRLDFPESLPEIRASRIKNKLKKKIYNPKYETALSTGNDSFIFNRETIDFILNIAKPTKEQVIFILALIDSDDTYKNYFFQNLTNPNWFDILKRQGFYDFKDADSLSIEPIIYLKNLSTEVMKTGNSELISEIIFLIEGYSKNGMGNARIWSLFVKILSNIPNDDIPVTILNFIPVWLKDDVHFLTVSNILTSDFLPKFLRNDPSSNELEKAEVIIGHLLSVEKKTNPSESEYGLKNNSFQSKASTAILKNDFDYNLINEIAQKCSDKIIIDLANTINCLRFDFPLGIYIKFKIGENEVTITYDRKRDVLTIKDSKDIEVFQSDKFENLNRLGQEELIQIVKKGLNKNELEFKIEAENKFQLDTLYTLIKYGSEPHKYDFVGDLGKNFRSEKSVDVFSFIFRELLNSKTQAYPDKGLELLSLFIKDWEYRLPFFKKIALNIIRKNWNIAENLFWEIVTDENSEIFFDSHYEKELYEVLEKHSSCFSENQLTTLDKIISNGPKLKSKKDYMNYEDHWRLRWYTALRKNPFFKNSYEKLSDRLNKTNVDFEEEGKVRWMNGMESPLTKKEILNKDVSETIKIIKDFKPENRWEEGSIEGLSKTLKTAIQENPKKFVKKLNKFENIPFVYGLQIANGFRDAWSEKREFEWDKVLSFFKDYVSSEEFIQDKLHLENDGWKSGKDVVLGNISDLLGEGLRVDKNAFELSLLPRVKELLKDIIAQLDTSDFFGVNQMDYVHYSLNSTPGKVLNALVNYSLRRARNLKLIGEDEKWEREIINIWEKVFDDQILEGFITFGRYFPQFVFLSEQWSINKLLDFKKLDTKYRYALLGGLSYSRPINKQIVYKALYPHFEFIFSENVTVKSISQVGLHNHIIAYAIWAEEDVNENGRMLWEFIGKGELKDIQSFLDYLWKQERYFSNHELEQQEIIQKLIEEIWCKIISRFKKDPSSEERKILLLTTRLLGYVLELEKHHTDLILSVKDNFGENDFFYQQILIKNIHKLLYNGTPKETSENIGKIISGLPLNYFVGSEKDKLKDIVLFLYQNGQVKFANVICDNLARVGQDFLVEIYKEYNN